jgi:hypothetical protein
MFDTKKPARIPVSDRRDPKSFETREPWQACERLNRGHDEDFVENDISSSGHPRQDVRDRDLADFDTIDHDRKGMAGHENFAGSVTGRAGLGMDQDLPPDHVEDPIEGDPHARINAGHLEVFIQTEMSDLDQEGDIDRFGVALLEFLIKMPSIRWTRSSLRIPAIRSYSSTEIRYTGRGDAEAAG